MVRGADTPEHQTHMNGKIIDIRNAPMTTTEEKTFLEVAVAHSNVQKVIFKTNHGVSSSKIVVDTSGVHDDHFHVETYN
ncbi:hypothetical protein [Tepidibacillus sp. HK-1]|uniref:hypothetical protein n=1 Tax=Tepidibacillus sp. HK-1 TaxID=1883407 RepID=UPI000858DA2E|nr:hypothetical protein [Tepidibacillus sp. HK-1]GBF11070.1 hypothetical protein HK1_01088 [Tepidibacillus sp. HK-1]